MLLSFAAPSLSTLPCCPPPPPLNPKPLAGKAWCSLLLCLLCPLTSCRIQPCSILLCCCNTQQRALFEPRVLLLLVMHTVLADGRQRRVALCVTPPE